MTDVDQLRALEAAIVAGGEQAKWTAATFYKAGTGPIYAAIPEGVFDAAEVIYILAAYNRSLDAAKALHDALLPEWWWQVGTCRVSDDARVSPEGPESVMPDGTEWFEFTDVDQRPSGNPARAWLLAIIRALIAGGQP